MGIDKKESVAEQLDDMLGLGEETSKKEETSSTEETKQETPAKEETSKKEETQTSNATLVTQEQVDITKNIAKIDLQIEALQSKNVDTDKFFETIEEHLSEEEQQLEFKDKPAYMKIVNTKLKEYESSNSNTKEIETLQDSKKEQESIYERQSAITEVVAKHPTYKHENVLSFFENDLSASQQRKIIDSSSSYVEVYEKTFEMFTKNNPSNIETVIAPNIPNINNIRKQPLKTNDVEESLMGDDEKIQGALGL